MTTSRESSLLFRTAEIISIGTELLIGQTVDTNAHFLSGQLTELGISTYRHTVVGDNESRLEKAIRRALDENDLVMTTGGLGPTRDDLTSGVVARIASVPLVKDRLVDGALERRYPSRSRGDFTDYPTVPEGAIVFMNDNGTAPGSLVIFSYNGKQKAILMLPGPPDEMRPMFDAYVRQAMEPFCGSRFIHRYVRLTGIGESHVENLVLDLVDGQSDVTIAPYASPGEVVIRVAQRLDETEGVDLTGPVLETLSSRLGEYIFELGPRSLEEVVVDLLAQKQATCAFAESCTVGLASAILGSVPGLSEVFLGAVISYSDKMKHELLSVPTDLLEREGAVSEACARAMAQACRDKTGADFALSFTGIAGPAGGSEANPVGTVWIACAGEQGTQAKKFQFRGNRDRVRKRAVYAGLDLLRRSLLAL
ncbi:MAG TPA: competence/damage-inducible protein A [Clostridia bacterium]|nr:competence/damage-inducible protein A [Clostridia bacterium]